MFIQAECCRQYKGVSGLLGSHTPLRTPHIPVSLVAPVFLTELLIEEAGVLDEAMDLGGGGGDI